MRIKFTLLTVFLYLNSAYAGAESLHASEMNFPIGVLQTKCIEFGSIKVGGSTDDVADCHVSEFGSLGSFRNHTYFYAIYCLIPGYAIAQGGCTSGSPNADYYKAMALAVFEENEETKGARLLLERAHPEIGMVWHEKPEIVTNAFGRIMYLPIRLSGTGAGNLSEYYLWDEGAAEWQLLEAGSWLRNLEIPSGLAIWKGVWPDLKDMSAKAALYRANDANCCPTGGTALIKLTIEGRRFAVKSLTIIPEENKKGDQ